MKEQKNILYNDGFNAPAFEISNSDDLLSFTNKKRRNHLSFNDKSKNKIHQETIEHCSLKPITKPALNQTSSIIYKHLPEEESTLLNPLSTTLFRFFIKNGEHVYGRANDIVMIESCNHLVNVYLAVNDTIKKTIRTSTLKDFLIQLPADNFLRISRFYAINIKRLSGGNCNEQTFEFDFKVSVKLKHTLPQAIFKNIGK